MYQFNPTEVPGGFVLRAVPTACGSIAVWEQPGREPALVMIHGNSASKSAFRRLLHQAALQDGRRILVLDLPGAGQSDNARNPEADYTFTAMARTIRAVLSAMGVCRPVVLGWSLGGHLAIEAAAQDAEFSALVLTGTPPCGPGAEEISAVFYPSALMEVVMGENPTPELLAAYVRALYGRIAQIDFELFEAARRFDGRMRRIFSENLMSNAEPRAAHQRSVVASWPNPIAVIQGDEEPFFDPRGLDSLTWKNLWRGKSQWVAGTGHAPFYENPANYATLVAAFLQEIGV